MAPLSSHDVRTEWQKCKGEALGHLNFRNFTQWSGNVGIDLPLGLEGNQDAGARKCRFSGHARCSCICFEAGEVPDLCRCGHKASMHRTDFAERSSTKFFEDVSQSWWTSSASNLVE